MTQHRLVAMFREQASGCERLGSPMYGELLSAMADDIADGGVMIELLRGHEHDPGPSALALRLAGGIHRLVLAGVLPTLAPYYPTTGGRWDFDAAWPIVVDVLRTHRSMLRESLASAPQTNEVGRSAALVGGLLHIAAETGLPVRLCEIGASAGLNLRADHYRYGYDAGVWGPPDSPLLIENAWTGVLPPLDAPLVVAERAGSDLAPIDATMRDGQLRVGSYVWPDQLQRWTRLQAALEVAATLPVELHRGDAVDAVRRLELRHGQTTVLWHSVMWQYLDAAARQAIDDRVQALGEQARASAPFAHLFLEPTRRTPDREHEFLVVLRTWPDGGDRHILGVASPHGAPTTWE